MDLKFSRTNSLGSFFQNRSYFNRTLFDQKLLEENLTTIKKILTKINKKWK